MWTVDRLMLRSKLQREQHELIPSNQCRFECELRQGPTLQWRSVTAWCFIRSIDLFLECVKSSNNRQRTKKRRPEPCRPAAMSLADHSADVRAEG